MRRIIENAVLILIIILLTSCSLTPQEKLKMYGCSYVASKNGFCCRDKVPDKDKYILNCEYAK